MYIIAWEQSRWIFWGKCYMLWIFLKEGKKSAVKAVLGASLIDLLVNCCTCIIKTLRQTDASVCTPEKKIVENKLIFFSFEYLWKREQKHWCNRDGDDVAFLCLTASWDIFHKRLGLNLWDIKKEGTLIKYVQFQHLSPPFLHTIWWLYMQTYALFTRIAYWWYLLPSSLQVL